MNHHRYRLIFNRARGVMMAVAEHVSARQGGASSLASAATAPAMMTWANLAPVPFSLMVMLGAALIYAPLAHADIVADPTAAANQQPIISNTASGVPLVNIQTPSSAGVSRNTYSQFDVNAQGAILNNSAGNVQTQLGGWVQGNANLAGGTARVILNEVNSNNPSLLNGFVEIAGSRAQLVIANPAGISCNGCGFINANRTTLTTGTPIMNSGNLLGYRVGGGTVQVSGNGMDATQANYTDIIARAVEVNAGIWANTLNVTTGTHQINVDANGNTTSMTTIAPSSGATPTFAVDVAALGGMYAGKIHLIGTEAGLGVRNAGTLGASIGEFTITNDGQLINTGHISAQGAASLTTTGSLDNTGGTLAANGPLTVQASALTNTGGNIASAGDMAVTTGAVVNTGGTLQADGHLSLSSTSLTGDGDILAQGNLAITTQGDVSNTGRMLANGDLQFTTDGTLTNSNKIEAGQALALSAQQISNTADGSLVGADTTLTASDTLTNRGLIDGGNTYLQAVTLNNIGTGRIYGDHLAIQASTLANDAETLNGTATAGTLAARERLDLGVATLTNQNGSLIFSGGDMAIGGSLDSSHQATGTAQSIINSSANVEALGELAVNADSLTNQRTAFTTQRVQVGSSSSYREECVDDDCDYVNHITTQKTEYEDQVVTSTPAATLTAGGNAQLNVGNLTNRYSTIEAGGDMQLTGNTLTNEGAELYHQTDTIVRKNLIHWGDRDHGTTVTSSSTSTLIDSIPGIISAGGTLSGSFTARIDNTTIRENTAPVTNPQGNSPATSTSIGVTVSTSSLFQQVPDATADFLIQTDPRFTNYKTWLSSDYMTSQLAFDPAITQKRLGDGFYEQQLIREQVSQLTGRRFLDGYASDEAQYQALMNNGLTQATSLQLVPGIALTPAQIAQLTSDIVWLVEQTVTLPDGTVTKALVPQVYVKLQDGDISPSGAVLAGNNVDLNVTNGTISTSGTIAGRNVVSLNAENIENVRGLISGKDVAVTATQDITVEGGSIKGQDSLIAQAGGDITVQSSTVDLKDRMQDGSATVSSHVIDRVAGLYVSNPDAVLVASAGKDLNLMAAVIQNSGANTNGSGGTLLSAGNNVNLGVVKETGDSYGTGMNSWRKEHTTDEIGSNISTTDDISIQAGKDLGIKGAKITSEEGTLSATAGGDISITAATSTLESDAYRKVKTTTRKKEFRDSIDQTTQTGSTLSADKINLQAGVPSASAATLATTATNTTGNLTIEGSNVVSTNGTTLGATGNVSITAVENTLTESHLKKVKQSGFSASGSSIGYSSSKLTQNQNGTTVTQLGSTVGSVNGDVTIDAGKTYTQTASDVLAPNGDISITAQQVNIQAANNTSTQTTETKYKQSGLSLTLSNPVVSAIQTADQMKQAASETSDGRMQLLAAATTGLSAKNAYDAVNAAKPGSDLAQQAGGINLSLSIGTSKSSSTSTQISSQAQGSTLQAGGDLSIKATGAGQDSDINITGSTVQAGNNVSLKADDKINLVAAPNTDTLTSKNKSSSQSIGVNVGVGAGGAGPALTVGASAGKGNANGSDVTWTETNVVGGNKVTLESGTDTNLIGAQVKGEQVVANVGTSGEGNLIIQSLQDTSNYDSKQKNAGGSITVGTSQLGASANISNTKVNSDYASVNEQAGIYAGDGGFQVNVNGNTDLKGAVIASNETAIAGNKNSLTTDTLTVSNISNSAEYKGESSSFSGGVGLTEQPNGGGYKNSPTASAGTGSESGSSSSVTVSGISGGSVSITDSTAQQDKTGQDAATTVLALNRDVHVDDNGNTVDSQGNSTAGTLGQIFDKEQVERSLNAQVQITQAFSQLAPKALGDYATNKANDLKDRAQQAQDAGDTATAQQLRDESKLWEEGGAYRVALHAALGGLTTGGLAGAVGAGASQSVIPFIGNKIAEMDLPDVAKQALIESTAVAIGAALAGDGGAGASLAATANNYLKHADIEKFNQELSDCKARNCTVAEKRAIAEKWKTVSDQQQNDFLDETLATGIDPNPKALYYVLEVPFSTGITDPDIQDIVQAIDKQNSYVKWLEISETAAALVGNTALPVARGGLLVKANSDVKSKLPAGVEVQAESVAPLNKKIVDDNPSYQPSYLPGTKVYTYTTPASGDKFVRVYVGEGASQTSQAASWMMRASDIEGLSPQQIKDKFALSQVPTYVTDVNIPAGQTMRASTANGILGNGGGGVQFEVTNKPKTEAEQKTFNSWFTNPRPLK
jgi:filamentous hemagglutinin